MSLVYQQQWMWLVGQVMHTLPEHLDSHPVFGGVPVAQSCIFCIACILRIFCFLYHQPDLYRTCLFVVTQRRLIRNVNCLLFARTWGYPLYFMWATWRIFLVSVLCFLFCCLRYVSLAQYCLWIQIFWLHLWLVKVYFLLFGIHLSLLFTNSFKFPGNSIIIAVK